MNGGNKLRKLREEPKFKVNRAVAMAKMQELGKSKLEKRVLEQIKSAHPDAVGSYVLDFYTCDIYVPSINTIIEVNGNYWHNKPEVRAADARKRTFIKNNHPDKRLLTLWESEVNDGVDLMSHALLNTQVYILAGPSGCGKSYLANKLSTRFNIVDYDKTTIEKIVALNATTSTIVVTPIRASFIAKALRLRGIRVCMLYLREELAIIEGRLLSRNSDPSDTLRLRIKRYESIKDRVFNFYGTQAEIEAYLSAF